MKFSKRIGFTTCIASLGGLLFGYDTAVISGAIEAIALYFDLDDFGTGLATSSALLGCLVGALLSGGLSSSLGRKKTLLIAACCYTFSALGSAFAPSLAIFVLLRILGGLGIGFSAVVPAYIAEIAPAQHRGMLTSIYQLSITLGILIIYLVNFYISRIGSDHSWLVESGWRWMLASETIPAALFLVLLVFIPESPRCLFVQGRDAEAYAVLEKLGYQDIELISSEISASIHEAAGGQRMSLKSRQVMPTLILVLSLAVLQQAVGINVIIYYADRVTARLWAGTSPYTVSIMIGIVNFLATLIAVFRVDHWGRKKLLFCGSLAVCLCQIIIGSGVFIGHTGAWMFVFILIYIVAFACSVGPLIWIIIAELAPNVLRTRFTSVAIFALWAGNIIVTFTFPLLNGSTFLTHYFRGGFPFFLYGGFALLLALITWRKLPETKGCSLEEIEQLVCS